MSAAQIRFLTLWRQEMNRFLKICLLYTSDAADE